MSRRKPIHRGERFSRLVVISVDSMCGLQKRWLCSCDCGNVCVVQASHLLTGSTRSCGCLRREVWSARRATGHRIEEHW